VFSTVGLPAERRVELWETHNANALIGLDVRATAALQATEVNIQLADVHLARVAATAHAVERGPDVVRRSPADAIAVYLTLRGNAWFRQQDGTRELRPGAALVCEADRPFARGFVRGLEELVIKVPRGTLPDVALPLSKPVITAFAGGARPDRYARALAAITSRATRTTRPVPADQGTIVDLVAVLLTGPASIPAAAHRAAARCYIEEHLTDPNLGAGQLAAAIGVSERQLSRVFAADGTSIPRHILSRRLQLARSILSSQAVSSEALTGEAVSSGARTGETVADVAAQCGFTSVTYFSRVFRSHFGVRASDVRRGRSPEHDMT
jgi:AraC-like DNA-binding protein